MQCRLTLYISLGIIRRYFTARHNLTGHLTLTRMHDIHYGKTRLREMRVISIHLRTHLSPMRPFFGDYLKEDCLSLGAVYLIGTFIFIRFTDRMLRPQRKREEMQINPRGLDKVKKRFPWREMSAKGLSLES